MPIDRTTPRGVIFCSFLSLTFLCFTGNYTVSGLRQTGAPPVAVINNILYQPGAHPLYFDLYQPQNAAVLKLPLVIYIHGGAWQFGDRRSGREVGFLLARAGFRVASIDYTLSGEAPFPAACKDVKTAVRYFRAEAAKWHIDPDHIGLIGNSAGAHLAAFAALSQNPAYDVGSAWQGYSSRVQALVGEWGPYDYRVQPANDAVIRFLGGTPREKEQTYIEASPINHLTPAAPPLLLIHGEQDRQVPIEHAERLAAAYRGLELPVELIRVKNAGHNMRRVSLSAEPDPPAEQVDAAIVAFFTKYLKGKAVKSR